MWTEGAAAAGVGCEPGPRQAELVDNAHRFVSRLAADRLLGYLHAQKAAVTGQSTAHTNRPGPVAAHGYDRANLDYWTRRDGAEP